MYGQHVTVSEITVFVFGVPSYSEEKWQELAKQQIIRALENGTNIAD